jgi:glutaminyl-peptide cyclotransferase
MIRIASFLCLLIGFSYLEGCKSKPKTENTETPSINSSFAKTFNADSAYFFIQKQVDFGPRVPNTPAHVQCGDYMVNTLKKYGFEVTEQRFSPKTYYGKTLKARNIIGSFNPNASKRILLAAHWDARPQSDKDATVKNKTFDAANDGGSGVGILLEIARAIHVAKTKPNIGVDIIFFDAEDDGEKNDMDAVKLPKDLTTWWCLGSQYWASNLHKPGYSAYYGILLDMAGAKDATFPKEGYSMQLANTITNNLWQTAANLGHSKFFIEAEGGGITDDHLPVNTVAKIPMIDILHQEIGTEKTFGAYHHTQDDNMQVIDKETLRAVGETVMQVLFQEGEGL